MVKGERVSRAVAIKAINDLFDRHFGSEKGSGEAYQDWCNNLDLYKYTDDPDDPIDDDQIIPGQFEFFLALGVKPDEIVEVLGVNPACFDELRELYAGAEK